MKFALIGHPVAGSLSPRLFTAAYGGRFPYELVDEPTFEAAWARFEAEYDGINVTAPYKQDAFARVDALAPAARQSGAVNLVVPLPGGGYQGYNTDVDGVVGAVKERGETVRDALVVGTGGAARAAVVGALQLGCRVTVTGRSAQKASALSESMGVDWIPRSVAAALAPGLLLHPLPGGAPVPAGLPLGGALVLEAEYKHPALASAPCRAYVGGLRWLLHQAVAGYALFTGEEPSVEAMMKTLNTL